MLAIERPRAKSLLEATDSSLPLCLEWIKLYCRFLTTKTNKQMPQCKLYLMKIFATAFTIATEIHVRE